MTERKSLPIHFLRLGSGQNNALFRSARAETTRCSCRRDDMKQEVPRTG